MDDRKIDVKDGQTNLQIIVSGGLTFFGGILIGPSVLVSWA